MPQEITIGKSGSTAMRVLEAVTPMTGVAAPEVNAEFIGQLCIDTATPAVYVSVAVGSETAANDWKGLTLVV